MPLTAPKYWSLVLLFFIYSFPSYAQVKEVEMVLMNQTTVSPVSNANIFIDRTEVGAISDDFGLFSLEVKLDQANELVVSHISYQSLIISPGVYTQWRTGDTLWLQSNGIDIDEVVITETKSKKWKKRFKKFKKEFLGNDKIGNKCKIINPEVLLFEEKNDEFIANALDLIHIDNPYLGYEIKFNLTEFKINKNNWVKYKGHSTFIDNYPEDPTYLERRNEVYKGSSRYFYRTLIQNELTQNEYEVLATTLDQQKFKTGRSLLFSDLVTIDSTTGYYLLNFDDFIQINIGQITLEQQQVNMNVRGADETAKFNPVNSGPASSFTHPQSQIYKTSPSIILNQFGHVLNARDVQEYGYWGWRRLGHLLPHNFDPIITTNHSDQITSNKPDFIRLINQLFSSNENQKQAAISYIENNWDPAFFAPLMDIVRLLPDNKLGSDALQLLQRIYGINHIPSYFDGLQFMWSQDSTYNSSYNDIKANLYQNLDPKFSSYFNGRTNLSSVRLDEVLWGGVKQDGIPPLRLPVLISGSSADYLSPTDIVFGIHVNGVARAYPKRILGWHEMVVDTIGGKSVTGVYCTLCGTMIAYHNQFKNRHFDLGTSGFLYRSNKLMYDKKTQSLWSTIEGKPVIGPLVNQGIELDVLPLVTTTWGEWLADHTDTQVLSLDTGHDRDYDEGAAYKAYYASDALMFPVGSINPTLKNKDEVFIIRIKENDSHPVAYSVSRLIKNKITRDIIGKIDVTIIAADTGNIRAYASEEIQFKLQEEELIDQEGNIWDIKDEFLFYSENKKLLRLPAHRIFWFAWYVAHPDTRLVR